MKDVEGIADRRRTRHVSRACVICRRRKTKCNGAEPSCGTCLAHGLQCEYSSEPDRRKTKDSQELASLKVRVAELEERLRACEGQPLAHGQHILCTNIECCIESCSATNTPGDWGAGHRDEERPTQDTSAVDEEDAGDLERNGPNTFLIAIHSEGDGAKGTDYRGGRTATPSGRQ